MELKPIAAPKRNSAVPVAALQITGADATRYLQGQITQDLTRVAEGEGTLSALPTVEGKLLTIVYLSHASPDSWIAFIPTPHLEAAIDRLKRFRLRVKVDFAVAWETSDSKHSTAISPWWPLGPGLVASDELVDLESFTCSRLERGSFYLPTDGNSHLLVHAIPGLVPAAVSFTKGCYVGQELINRTDSRKAPPPELLQIADIDIDIDIDTPASAIGPEPLLLHGEDAGVVTAIAVGPGFAVAALRIKRRFAAENHFEFTVGAKLAVASVRR